MANASEAVKLTCLQCVLNQAAELLSGWTKIRDNIAMTSMEAMDILATWSHLRRFPEEQISGDDVREFDRFVEKEFSNLVVLASSIPFSAATWIKESEHLYRCYDTYTDPNKVSELEMHIRQHFDQLDRYGLMIETAVDPSIREKVYPLLPEVDMDGLIAEQTEAEHWVRQHPEYFYAMGALAKATWTEYRSDLIEFDSTLWENTVKYRHVAEAWQLCPIRPEPLT